MVVFLGRDLYETLQCVLRRFIKEDIIANANSAIQLINIDVENDSNHNCSRQIKEVEVGNLKQENIVVCDAISSAGGISKVPLVNEMLMSCSRPS